MLKWDGHTHTKYCRHGNPAEQELYLDRALELGFERYTLTEHPPLPDRWVQDEKLMEELAMDRDELPSYLDYAKRMKESYAGRLEVTIGLELDYLDGHVGFSEKLIEGRAGVLEDLVISVHYLPGVGGIRCIDFTPEDFREGLIGYYGTMNAVAEEYFNHVEKAIAWAAGLPGRKRMGHLGLIEKFRTALPLEDADLVDRRLRGLLPKLAGAGLGVDVNTAGLRVATCGKPYVPEWFLRDCRQLGIPLVYGSDSHRPDHVGTGWDWFEGLMKEAL